MGMEVACALQKVAKRGDSDVVTRLIQLLGDKHWWTRLAAVEALTAVADRQQREAVSHVLEFVDVLDSSPSLQWRVDEENVLALIGIPTDPTAAANGEPLDAEDVYARFAAVRLM